MEEIHCTTFCRLGLILLLLSGCLPGTRRQAPSALLGGAPIGRTPHADRLTYGLEGEELRQARFENMVEAFLDAKDLEEQIARLDRQRWSWERRRMLKQNRVWLKAVRAVLAENAAAFPPEERAIAVREEFPVVDAQKFVRRVTITLGSGRVIVRENEYSKPSPIPLPDP